MLASPRRFSVAGCDSPPLGFALALVVEIGLGLLLLLGYRVRPAALVATH
jgi:uncharacterized membrane protein YphA (DoxX/SURF4 family)